MFSGLVNGTGKVKIMKRRGETIKLTIQANKPDFTDGIQIGDSICVDGTCLTVEKTNGQSFSVTLMPQTFEKTTFKLRRPGSLVNLERSLEIGKRLEGHIVTGHVDEVVNVIKREPNENSVELTFNLPSRLSGQVVPQGSVAINGVSLTVMDTGAQWFSVGLIPHTQAITNLDQLQVNDQVNLETDIIGKYIVANLNKGVDHNGR